MPNTCVNNNHLPGQFYVATSSGFWTIPLLTLLKMYPWRKRALLTLNKKILGKDIFLKKCSVKRVLLFCCIRYCPYFLQETLYMHWRSISLEEIILIWIIHSKVIFLQHLYKVYGRELGQYLMLFNALEKKCNETTHYSI